MKLGEYIGFKVSRLDYVRKAAAAVLAEQGNLRGHEEAYADLRTACVEAAEVFALEEIAEAAHLTRERIRQWVAQEKRRRWERLGPVRVMNHPYNPYELALKTIEHVKHCPHCRVVVDLVGRRIELCSVGDGIEQSIRKESL